MNTIKAPVFFLLILCSFSFRNVDDDVKKCLIREGETIAFSSKPAFEGAKNFITMSKGSYDGSGFQFQIDSFNNITIGKISPSYGPKQDEIIIAGCTGSLTRTEDGLTIQLEKCRNSYYLVDLDNAKLVGSFDTIVQVMLKSEKPTGESAEYYCHEKDHSGVRMAIGPDGKEVSSPPTIHTVHLTAVPAGIKKDDLYTAKHPANTLALFKKVELKTEGGKILRFPSGSYILFEGNSFKLN